MNPNRGCFKLNQGIVIKGNIIKNGLDTSRLVNLIIRLGIPDEFKLSGSPFPPNLFYVSDISFGESVGILINKLKISKEEAVSKVKKWYELASLQKISEDNIETIIPHVEETNKGIVEELGEDYEIGEKDVKIIASFVKEGINVVHSGDKGFKETCKRLNMNILGIPIKDVKEEESIKKKSRR